ncbi:hypothetical protein EVAR_62615_1 [Eumeta japonica]|uniref:Uncharacterized protein n=1 Tax=Eumeta variegata TaxID=151549 RepID=A0A4C1ZCU1_EUMVA|nr:hypothetical protein EVAR_62615_1 [Eumeta japonica]
MLFLIHQLTPAPVHISFHSSPISPTCDQEAPAAAVARTNGILTHVRPFRSRFSERAKSSLLCDRPAAALFGQRRDRDGGCRYIGGESETEHFIGRTA